MLFPTCGVKSYYTNCAIWILDNGINNSCNLLPVQVKHERRGNDYVLPNGMNKQSSNSGTEWYVAFVFRVPRFALLIFGVMGVAKTCRQGTSHLNCPAANLRAGLVNAINKLLKCALNRRHRLGEAAGRADMKCAGFPPNRKRIEPAGWLLLTHECGFAMGSEMLDCSRARVSRSRVSHSWG